MINSVVLYNDESTDVDISFEELKDNKKKINWYWINISKPSESEKEMLKQFIKCNEFIEMCCGKYKSPKLEKNKLNYSITLPVLNDEIKFEKINLFLSPLGMISYCENYNKEIEDLFKEYKWLCGKELQEVRVIHCFSNILEEIVKKFSSHLQDLIDQILNINKNNNNDDVSDLLEKLLNFEIVLHSMNIFLNKIDKKFISDMLFFMLDKKSVSLTEIMNFIDQYSEDYLSDVKFECTINNIKEKTKESYFTLKGYKDIINEIRENYNSTNASKMNQTMQNLTIIMVSTLPFTIMAGIFGMNFENLPFIHVSNHWMYIILGSMPIFSGILLYLIYKPKWIKNGIKKLKKLFNKKNGNKNGEFY